MYHQFDVSEADVRCPFYRGYTNGTVRCEGPLEGATNTMGFADGGQRRQHMEIFCCRHYRRCEVYRMVQEAKYAED